MLLFPEHTNIFRIPTNQGSVDVVSLRFIGDVRQAIEAYNHNTPPLPVAQEHELGYAYGYRESPYLFVAIHDRQDSGLISVVGQPEEIKATLEYLVEVADVKPVPLVDTISTSRN